MIGPLPVRRPVTLVVLAAVTACASPEPGSDADRTALSPVELGELLFTTETFQGNGRVCSTCHVLEGFGTMSPELIQAKFARDPTDPLFRSIDSDDGVGEDYTRLLEHGTVRVPIPLGVHEPFGLSVRRCDAPADTVVWLNRGNPSVFNIALERHLMVDGRDGESLPTQAGNAVNTHAEPGRQPTPEELDAIAAFQRTLFSSEAVRRFLETGAGLGLPDGRTPAEIRGREFFNEDRQCGVCHAGPMLNQTGAGHPDGPGLLFESATVGMNPDNPNPKYDWCWVDPATDTIVVGPNDSRVVTRSPTSDPGAGLLPGFFGFPQPDGSVDEVPHAMLAAAIGDWFKLPTLWGSPETAPYFHDNSAKDLAAVLDHYNFMFSTLTSSFVIGCEPRTAECLSPGDKEDIIAYMQLLSFDEV
ncbi:MAG TPA: hypothetical protein VLA43_03290, partial [Longimicrobiales bacterium]|nr:hypothetical protein [Longimicrobiales bacterium]